MKLKLERQYLEDLSKNFMPIILRINESDETGCSKETQWLYAVCKSVLQDVDVTLKRKALTSKKNGILI